ncbi:catenin alpha-2 isoform X1, partial [Lates japonicus]
CPDSACKQDLLAYLQRIALYCHQLNICSKVKAEVQNLGGELVVSGRAVGVGGSIADSEAAMCQ